ncbi:MAG: TonB-dependent receptor plug domain-containing protein [Bacteroidota bacterium]
MKKLLPGVVLCVFSISSFGQSIKKFNDTAFLKPVEIWAVRATDKAPFAKTNISQKEIEKVNLGQDVPFILNQTPSVVTSSDAGNGIGYTGIRIRGTDGTRINVTLNGIPYNDVESQATYWVDLPDFASSANSMQIQRGVGTSSNGGGAFGASINIATNELNKELYAEANNSYGSYNSWKNTIKFGSGLLGKHFTIDGRLSQISSDGYIERAKTKLRSYYMSTAWTDEKNSIRLNIFSGKERTYQAWDGVPQDSLTTNRRYNSAGTEKPGTPYQDQVDDYLQTHYQLFYNHQWNQYWKTNIAFFLTRGKGYYEQYKAGAALGEYGLPDFDNGSTIITETDLARRLWLDNYFYGTVYSVQHKKNKTEFTAGGAFTKYDGKHYGNIIWAQEQAAVPSNYRWYNLTAYKKDLSLFAKWSQQFHSNWQSFIDLQYRNVIYNINGFRNNPTIVINKTMSFFNPKAGITYTRKDWTAYASYAIASHEPNRDDFESTVSQPKSELLQDIELGVERRNKKSFYSANLYYMKYHDQLVLVGNINDVGAYTRTNVPNSYRLGIELQGKIELSDAVNIAANATFSWNKIKNYTELIDDYDVGGTKNNFYQSTHISFSPSVVAGGSINFIPVKNAAISLISKYVGRQYLDNTSNINRSLDPYYLQDVRLSYLVESKILKATTFIVQLNNVFNKKYEANGYTFSYVYDSKVATENFYFPMAPFNFMVGINVRL